MTCCTYRINCEKVNIILDTLVRLKLMDDEKAKV